MFVINVAVYDLALTVVILTWVLLSNQARYRQLTGAHADVGRRR